MDILIRILEIVVWPATILTIVVLLRNPIAQLVPTLKTLKYKELEIEFEKEAGSILAEAERDLPEPTPAPEFPATEEEAPDVRFSTLQTEPAGDVITAWRHLELDLRSLAERNNVQSNRSIRSLILALEEVNLLLPEQVSLILRLAAYRNRVAHTAEEAITFDAASSYNAAVQLVRSTIGRTDAERQE